MDGVRTLWRRVVEGCRQAFRPARLMRQASERDAQRVAMIEGRRVLPALTKGVLEIADGRTSGRELYIVPWRIGSVAIVELDCLRIAGVA